MKDNLPVGTCTSAHYYEDSKAIRFTLKFGSGKEYGFEWPITMFRFPDGSDKDEEMRKTANLMPGKKIAWDLQDGDEK